MIGRENLHKLTGGEVQALVTYWEVQIGRGVKSMPSSGSMASFYRRELERRELAKAGQACQRCEFTTDSGHGGPCE